MQYRNPVILADYSDPDVIRVGEDFYMVASSFNHVPGVPVLHSKNLVEWELVNHVLPTIPFARFGRVCHGDGAWAPSLRWHDGTFFCLIPFPDEGIFVSEADDPRGTWSPLRPLLVGKGYEDPCPLWTDGKCSVVFAFVKSRIGFNSRLAVFETDSALTKPATGYRFVYDGRDCNPTIEGPKFHKRGDYFYILAPAGGVSDGWQVALRSKNVYGPYESRTILVQGDTAVNGPHQGALVDLDDAGTRWAFLHFQERGAFGRVVHVQPAAWTDDGWVRCGVARDGEPAGQPVAGGDYPVAVKTDYAIDPNDDFTGGRLSPVWQTPANPGTDWYRLENGLRLACVPFAQPALSDLPQLFMQKVCLPNFTAECRCTPHLVSDGDETGMVVFGEEYAYICAVRENGQTHIELRRGTIGASRDETLCHALPGAGDSVTFRISAASKNDRNLAITFACDGSAFDHPFSATPGRWTGAKIGIYARARTPSAGSATFAFFHVTRTE
ncbi:MAG: glycoside hydrolase 43 family protein [Treponemataceae bacterium]|nr:glycoside hydrolase 43 family protein [Treponemataceae bacterium]